MNLTRLLRGWCLFVLTLACNVKATAGTMFPAEVPPPLRSADLRKWMVELKPSDAQRVQMEQAFDACVEEWQRLRDGTVRPAEAKLDAAKDDAKALDAWHATLARATESMAGIERTMFAAIRAACVDDAQRMQADRVAAARARGRAAAAVHAMGVSLPRVPGLKDLPEETRARIQARQTEWELSATPTIERLAAATLDGAQDRERDLARKVLLSQRSAARDIAALLPKDAAERYLRAFRRNALPQGSIWSGFEGLPPAMVRRRLDPATQADAVARLEAWERKRDELQEQALDALVAAGAPGEMLAALSDEFRKLNDASLRGIAESAGMPDLDQPNEGFAFAMMGEDGDGGLPEGLMSGAMTMSAVSMGEGAPMGAEGNAMVSSVMVIRSDTGAGEAEAPAGVTEMRSATIQIQTTGDAPILVQGTPVAVALPPEVSAQIGEAVANAVANGGSGSAITADSDDPRFAMGMPGARRVRPLGRQDIDAIRTRLAVPDAQRTVWDALADDLLQAAADWTSAAPSGRMGDMLPAQGQSVDDFVKARAQRRAELARLEDAWFDNLKAGMQGLAPGAVDTERARRALQRERGAARGGGLMMSAVSPSRAAGMDLDQAADRLSADGRTRSAAALAAWRRDLTEALAALGPLSDDLTRAQLSMMKASSEEDDQGGARTSMNLTIDETQMAELDKLKKPLQAAWKRVDQVQETGLQSMLASLPQGDARALRRAVLKQTHPEAFRSQEQVDAALARTVALPGLTPEQLQAVDALADAYRSRSETLVERSIERTDRADAAVQGLMAGMDGPGQGLANFKAMQSTERNRSDAGYDREELNARAMRQLRALLSPEQAAAAKLN